MVTARLDVFDHSLQVGIVGFQVLDVLDNFLKKACSVGTLSMRHELPEQIQPA
jgi:hypothetical protein